MAHAPRIVIDNASHLGQVVFDLQDFVDLFLVFRQHDSGIRVVNDVLQLAADGILIQRHRHAPSYLHGHHGPVDLRPVVTQNGQFVAFFQTDRHQAQGQGAHFVQVLRPGPFLPDAFLLFPYGDIAWMLLDLL
jgi:hypothetical protein